MECMGNSRAKYRNLWLGVLLLLAVAAAALWFVPAWRAALIGSAGPPEGFTAIRGTVMHFSNIEQGRAVLGADDEWLPRTSELQRATLMGRDPPAGIEPFRAWQAEAVQAWTPAARARWQHALEVIAPALDRLQLPWPPEVLLVQTSGRESADQPHTRANAVVLPAQFEQQGFSDAEVLAHELWHVLSRRNPELATKLYALIGYEPVADLQWPPLWLPLRIVNQDAPFDRHAMRLSLQGRSVTVMPVLLAAPESERAPGQSLLNLMAPRLLEVQPGEGSRPTIASLDKGEPIWHDIEATPEFLERLGGNTDYTLHPDETIADNFMFLVSGRAAKNPELLKRIEAVLREAHKP